MVRRRESRFAVILGRVLFFSLAWAGLAPTAQSQAVLTYHYDTLRTGWNPNETTLTPQNVSALQLLASVPLDEQVDAQPLLVPALTIAGGTHDVLYVVTENDTVYALDAETGAVLLSRNLGTPVPQSVLPGQCNNNSASVGINSTPVIDTTTSTMYVMVYTYESGVPIYRLHALDLTTLNDTTAPAVVSASAPLSNGQTYSFNPSVQRQRTGLLEANGNIYAGFGSFCDIEANLSRGWLLGWQTGSLAPLPANRLDDRLATSANNFFLSSVWMSGYGLAADPSGDLYFSTGNSDYSGTSYDTTYNLSESVVKMSPDLTMVASFFTPSDPTYGVKTLDIDDADTGSGGVLLLPSQGSSVPGLAVAAGKVGQMYLLNRNSLGGYSSNGVNQVIGTYSIGGCWCGPSYFQGSDGIGRVVSSGGDNIDVWKVVFSPNLTLAQESASPLSGAHDSSISTSNANDLIIGAYRLSTTASPTAGTGWNQVGGANYQLAEYQIVSAPQSNLDVAIGAGEGDNNGGIADAIVQASGGTLGLDGSADGTATSGSSITVPLTTSAAGDVVLALVTLNGPTIAGISSPHTGTWSQRAVGGVSPYPIFEWYATAAGALSNESITIKFSGPASYVTVDLVAIKGANVAASPPPATFDGAADVPVESGATFADSTISTSNANDFIAGAYRLGTTASPTAGTGWNQVSGANYQLAEYQIVSAPQSNLDVAIGAGERDNNGGVADAIVQASGGTLGLDGRAHGTATSGSSITVPLTTSTAGDLVLAFVTLNGPNIVGIGSPHTGTWSQRAVGGASPYPIFEWYATAAGALSNESITISFSGPASYVTVDLVAIKGANIAASPPPTTFDGAADVPVKSGATFADSTISTSNANDLIAGAYRLSTTASPTAGTGWNQVSGANYQLAEYQIVSAPQSNLDVAIGAGERDNNGGVADAIVQASGGTLGLDGRAHGTATSGSSITVPLTTSTAGDLVLAFVTLNGPNIVGIGSPHTGTWSQRAVGGASPYPIFEWYATAAGALSNESITISFSGPASYVTVDLVAIKGANIAASPPPSPTFDSEADVPVENDSTPGNANPAQDPGFFTTVSSNGTQNAVIWAVGRPVGGSPNVTLYALDPLAAAQGFSTWLFSAVAGTWPNTGGNANIVPVVANGHVYVASYKQLAIFGLGSGPAASLSRAAAPLDATRLAANEHEIRGTIQSVSGDMLTVVKRNGEPVDVDATQAAQTYRSVVAGVGDAVRMLGRYDASGVFRATAITHAKASAKLWPPDR